MYYGTFTVFTSDLVLLACQLHNMTKKFNVIDLFEFVQKENCKIPYIIKFLFKT